jgi:hypothetical protein
LTAAIAKSKAAGLNVLTKEQLDARLLQQADSTKSALEAEVKKAAQATLKEQGDLVTLNAQLQADLDKHTSDLTALTTAHETVTASLAAYETFINKQIDADVKEWPALVKEFDPGKESLTDRMTWWEKAKKHTADLVPSGPYGGNPRGPKANGVGGNGVPVTSPVSHRRF